MKRPHVLVVDADPLLRFAVTCVLSKQGCRVMAIECAEQGFAMFERDDFDIVLVDAGGAALEGLGLMHLLVASGKATRLLLWSSEPTIEAMEEAASLGVPLYQKPHWDLPNWLATVALGKDPVDLETTTLARATRIGGSRRTARGAAKSVAFLPPA